MCVCVCVCVVGGGGGVTVLKMIYKQQNCHSNLCRPVDCLDLKLLVILLRLRFPPFHFFHVSSVFVHNDRKVEHL